MSKKLSQKEIDEEIKKDQIEKAKKEAFKRELNKDKEIKK